VLAITVVIVALSLAALAMFSHEVKGADMSET
jgi:hypothetical protein